MPVPTMLLLPWQRTVEPRPENALLFASRFDSTGLRQGWRLFTGGIGCATRCCEHQARSG